MNVDEWETALQVNQELADIFYILNDNKITKVIEIMRTKKWQIVMQAFLKFRISIFVNNFPQNYIKSVIHFRWNIWLYK